jgi:type II secretory pathway pseudopilin PulG
MSLLFFVATLGVGIAVTAISWQTASQREKERELLFIGSEFREAIALYYHRSPGSIKEYPKDLNDLLKDSRYPVTQRYLRRIYRDPMTGLAQWGTIPALGGGIMGVHSLSKEAPIKKAGFTESQKEFSEAGSYADWKFAYLPPTPIEGAALPLSNSPPATIQPPPSPRWATSSSPKPAATLPGAK